MKKLIIRYSKDNSLDKPEIMGEMNKIITKQLSEYGVLFLPNMFEYEVVDINAEEKEKPKYVVWNKDKENYKVGDIVKYEDQLYIKNVESYGTTFEPNRSCRWKLYEE